MTKKVALLVGGWSAEREGSLMKGVHIEKALIEGGYEVQVIDVTSDIAALIEALNPKPDAVFNNLYGRGGEDGVIQGILEALEIPYTHSGVEASAIGMNKPMTKRIAASAGVPSPMGVTKTKAEVLAGDVMEKPYVVKPLNEGSSVGVRIVMDGENQQPLDEASWSFGNEVLVERFIPGREIHVAVLDGVAQGVTEIKFPGRFFDYEAKYSDQRTELVTPASVPEAVTKAVMGYAETVFKELGCRGLARCDFRFDEEQFNKAGGNNSQDSNSQSAPDGIYFLEINTMPGLAPGSVALIQPEHNGMTFVQLCSHLVETATCQAVQTNQNVPSSAAKTHRQSA